MNRKKKIVTALFIVCVVPLSVYASLIELGVLPTHGEVKSKTVGFYPENIEWGMIELGKPVERTVSVMNEGPHNITDLTMTYVLPSDFTGTLTWNLEGQSLNVGESSTAIFTLNLTTAPETPFDFNITLHGK